MKMRKSAGLVITLALIAVFFANHEAFCNQGYNYISVEELKARMDRGDLESGAMVLVTTQTEEEYASGHIKGAYPTYARPLETDEDFAKLDSFLEMIKDNDAEIVIICPGGRSGAERPFDYFTKHGIAAKRLLILKDGQRAFNSAYPDLVSY